MTDDSDSQEPAQQEAIRPITDGSSHIDRANEDALDSYDLQSVPGHLLRRSQQRAVDLYMQEVGDTGPTPRQFAVLVTIHQNPGLSQINLVSRTGIDRSTVADMIDRLVRRGMVRRQRTTQDQRVNALFITEAGRDFAATAVRKSDRAQERILDPIPQEQRAEFKELLTLIAGLTDDPNGDR